MVESCIKSLTNQLKGNKKIIQELQASNESLQASNKGLQQNNRNLQAIVERLQAIIEKQEKEIEKWKLAANKGRELLCKSLLSRHCSKNKTGLPMEVEKEKDYSEELNFNCSSSSSEEIKSLKKAVEKLSADIKRIQTSLSYTPCERPLPDFYT